MPSRRYRHTSKGNRCCYEIIERWIGVVKTTSFIMEKEIILYLLLINILAFVLTVYDKLASKKFRKNRIRENILLLVGFLGGGLLMYITMRIINHKTRHKKFMLGLPLMVIFHLFIIYAWSKSLWG